MNFNSDFGPRNEQASFNTAAAYEFLREHNDPINNVRLAHWRGSISDEAFWKVLSQYQNPNGGFKGGIDPDYVGDQSSIHSTIEAMRIMVAHQQMDMPGVARTIQFLRSTEQPDGTWCELPSVMSDPLAPEWYAPAQLRLYETSCIAGYGLELGFSEVWSSAVKYVRNVWSFMPEAETAHPYWAVLLLLGRSPASQDKSIALDALDMLGNFVRKNMIDPYDCSTVVEILDRIEYPEAEEMMFRLAGTLAEAQSPEDGGIRTAYGEHMRPNATFNALMAIALMAQRGILS